MNRHKDIRVGIVTENHFPRFGGMEFCNHFIASSLNQLPGTKAAVACSDMPEVPRSFAYPYPVYRARSFSYLTRYLVNKNMEKMILKEKINILHGMMLHGGGAKAVKAARKCSLPVVVHSHGSDVQCIPEIGYGARLNPRDEANMRYTIKNAERIIAVSSLNRDMLVEMGAEPGKIFIIHNGVLFDEIGQIPVIDMRYKYGLKSEDFVILSVGRNRPIKRLSLLFEALSLLKGSSQIKCLCIGPTEDLVDMAKEYNVEDQLVLTGPVPPGKANDSIAPPFPELINLYRAADLFISVSYVEAFSLSGIDALACGVPILVSKATGIRDIIVDGENGFILQDESPSGLAKILVRLSQERRRWQASREDIRRSVSHLSWLNIAQELRQAYLSVLN
jgi:glycosyltransferase involved in cell wall biosynthesis